MMKSRSIAIIQPSFLPWRGYFDIIHKVDAFVFFDDVSYTTRDWRNRNRINGPNGTMWVTVPVETKGQERQRIDEAKICDDGKWQRKVLRSLEHGYRKAPFFNQYYHELEIIFSNHYQYIADIDIVLTIWMCGKLGIDATYARASMLNYNPGSGREDRLIGICKAMNAKRYISGPTAKAYLGHATKFQEAEIELQYMRYGYPEYRQYFGPYEENLSTIDLLMNCGPWSGYFIWGHSGETGARLHGS